MKNKSFSIWLIGPTASGKSTVAKLIYDKINKFYSNLVILDGDELRDLYDNKLGYDLEARKKNMQRYIKLSKWLQNHNINIIAAINGAIQSDRDLLRKEIKDYNEIYLNCSLEKRIKRDKKKLYERALKGEIKNVLDVDMPFEKPTNCDLECNADTNSPEEVANQIISFKKLI